MLMLLRISDHDRFDGNVFPNGPACHVRREGGREWDGVLLYLHIIDHDGIGGGVFLNRPGTRPTEEGPETRSTCHVRREGGRT